MKLPRARTEDLIVQDVEDELVVYDRRSHRVHCLNRAAAVVWRRCDGRSTPTDAARELRQAGLGADVDVVRLALRQLGRARLLEDAAPRAASPGRRALIRRLGLTAAALPLVTGIVAPTPAEAATCLFDIESGRPCSANQCGRECGGQTVCGTSSFYCKNIGGGNYRCVPESAGSCP